MIKHSPSILIFKPIWGYAINKIEEMFLIGHVIKINIVGWGVGVAMGFLLAFLFF